VTVTDANSCAAPGTHTTTATVNPTPSAGVITGTTGLCVGGTTTLSDTATGGIWSASSGIAAIGSSTGVVTTNAISQDVISYTVSNVYGCSNTATANIFVEGTPGNIYAFSGNGTNTTTGDGGPAYLATIQNVRDMATDNAGNLYFTDVTANVVRKISATGVISRFAGTGTAGNTGDGGQATAATLNAPNGIYVDNGGNVYVSNTNSHTVRKINGTTGIITTIAGTGGVSGASGDGGPATACKLYAPLGITGDAAGNLYICDQLNYKVRKINGSNGTITTIAGTGSNYFSGDGGPGTAARMSTPRGVALDRSNNLYIADGPNGAVRKLSLTTGIMTTVAGIGGSTGSTGDGGPATAAKLNTPARVLYDGGKLLYITDMINSRIRQLDLASGIISTAVGDGTGSFGGDGGSATAAQIWGPYGITRDNLNNLYIADANNRRIRIVASKGSIGITLAGPTSVPAGTTVTFTANASTTHNVAYQWQKNGTNVGSGATSYSNSSPANGDVYRCILTVTPECGSTYSDTSNSITLTVYGPPPAEPLESGIGDASGRITLYPNPANSIITLSANRLSDGAASIVIYDRLGKQVMTKELMTNGTQLKEALDISLLTPGVYLVRLTEASGKTNYLKFVKN